MQGHIKNDKGQYMTYDDFLLYYENLLDEKVRNHEITSFQRDVAIKLKQAELQSFKETEMRLSERK